MRTSNLSLPEIALVAATRGMLGAGIALLLADTTSREKRRAIGWTLAAIGAVTTVPLALEVASHARRLPRPEGEGPEVTAHEPAMRGEVAAR